MMNEARHVSEPQNSLPVIDIDVVIIGAGVSGLSAAYYFQKKDAGIRLAVLEAKGRIGGRTVGQTLNAASGKETWDLGGQWVGSCQPDVMQLIKDLDLSVFPQYSSGTKLLQLHSDARVSRYASEIPSLPILSLIDLQLFMWKINCMQKRVDIADPASCASAVEWDSMTFEQFKQQNLRTAAAKKSLDAALRCVFGTEAVHMSLLYFLCYVSAAGGLDPLLSCRENFGGQEFKVVGGAWQICSRLLKVIGKDRVHLNMPVTAIHQDGSRDAVLVRTSVGQTYRCKRVVMAMPPCSALNVEFCPPLPIIKHHVWQRMPPGNITKIIVTYKKAFWRAAGLSGEAVANGGKPQSRDCPTGPLCIIFDATSASGNAAIVAFIGGDQHLQYQTLMEEGRKQAVLHQLSELFGSDALSPLDYCEKNWTSEPYCGGGPVSVCTPGAMIYAAAALRLPFDRIHFAGTETATVWCGFMNGAVQAGRRAAMEVIYHLRPQAVEVADLDGTAYDARRKTSDSGRRGRTTQTAHSRRRHWPILLALFVGAAFLLLRRRRLALSS